MQPKAKTRETPSPQNIDALVCCCCVLIVARHNALQTNNQKNKQKQQNIQSKPKECSDEVANHIVNKNHF
jgi:hypothetical protein